MIDMIPIFSNLLRLVLLPIMWSILEKCSMCTWKECIFFCLEWNVLKLLIPSGLMCHLKPLFSFLIFNLDDLPIDVNGVLRPLLLLPYCWYLLLHPSIFALCIQVPLHWVNRHLWQLCPLVGWSVYCYEMPHFVFVTALALKSLLSDVSIAIPSYFLNFIIVVQAQVSPLSPHPIHSHLLPSILLPCGFVHGSFIQVPGWPFPFFPPLSSSPLWLLSVCSLFQCLWLYLACLYVLLIRFHL